MKRLHLLLAILFVLNTSGIFSQYLSFIEGIKNTTEAKTIPERNVLNGADSFVEITYNFSGAKFSETKVEGKRYNFLHIDGFAIMGQIGAPALPVYNEIIAMPNNSTGKVIILSSEYIEYEGFNIHPVLEPARDTEGATEPEFKKDEKIYSSDEFFPQHIVEVTEVLLSRETSLSVTQVRPVQFNPVTGKIRVYTKIGYKLEFIGGNKSFSNIGENNSIVYTNQLKRNVINSESIPDGISYKNHDSKAGEKNYIIITHSNYLTAANNLANWKRQMGYSVEVISQSSWTATQVKTEIQSRYTIWTPKPDYFVIIGDNEDVPGEIVQSRWAPYDDFWTDNYYSCMNGSSDYVPDMARGRISVSSSAEALTTVQKMIDYEYNPVDEASFYSTVLNCAQFQDYNDYNGYADRRFCQTSEEIRDYLLANTSLTINRIYQTNNTATPTNWNSGTYSAGEAIPSELLKSNGFPWYDNNSQEAIAIINEINSGRFFVLHRDHGYTGGSGWSSPYFTTASVNSLTNQAKQPVVFSINCHTGSYQVAVCLAEKLIRKSNGGAVGVFGAAYSSPSGLNDAFAIGLFDAIWSNPGITPNFTGSGGSQTPPDPHQDIYTLGDVLNHGLVRQVQTWNQGPTWNSFEHELMHYFGDPAMKIWTSNPNTTPILASHPSSLSNSTTSITITGCNVSDALATMVYDGELIGETQLSGGSGTITFSSLTNASIDAILTISKHNHKPYSANIDVLDVSNLPVADFTANDTTPFVWQTVNFTDLSTNSPSSWLWSFSPSTITYSGGTTPASQNPQVKFNSSGKYSVELIATNTYGSNTEIKTDYIYASTQYIDMEIIVFLEGPFDINSMNPDLTSVLPMDQPYDVAPWNYNGAESVAAIDPDYVDWVLVELRDALTAGQANSGTILARQAAFVNTAGEVIAADGSPVLRFTETLNNNLFVVVHHRNHLSVMSATPVTETAGIYSYDFSTDVSQAYQSGEKLVNGKAVMLAADGNSDGMVNFLDETPVWEMEAGEEGFLNSDYNLDGQSDNKDKDEYWAPNQGEGTKVPN